MSQLNEQLQTKTSYLVMIGNLFIANPNPILISTSAKGAMEFDYKEAMKVAGKINGVLVRKTVEYEVVSND